MKILNQIPKIRFIAIFVLIAIATIMVARGITVVRTNQEIKTDSRNVVSVEVQTAKMRSVQAVISYKGTIEPKEYGIVSSKIAGRVTNIYFENGDKVEQGHPLIKLDDQDVRNQLNAARNQLSISEVTLQKSQINLDAVQLNYSRTKSLFDQGALAKVNLDNAQTSLDTAQSDLQLAKANVQSAKINVNSLNDQLENMIIRAPISGTIDEKNVYVGQYVTTQGSSTALAKVKSVSLVDAVIQIEQNDLSRIQICQAAFVKLENNQSFDGIVKSIDPSANPTSRSFDCKVELTNVDNSLLPGQYVTVDIPDYSVTEAITIPVNALMGSEDNYYIFIAEHDTAQKCPITIGKIFNNTVEIKSGVKQGDNMITSNINMLQDGDKIKIKKQED